MNFMCQSSFEGKKICLKTAFVNENKHFLKSRAGDSLPLLLIFSVINYQRQHGGGGA